MISQLEGLMQALNNVFPLNERIDPVDGHGVKIEQLVVSVPCDFDTAFINSAICDCARHVAQPVEMPRPRFLEDSESALLSASQLPVTRLLSNAGESLLGADRSWQTITSRTADLCNLSSRRMPPEYKRLRCQKAALGPRCDLPTNLVFFPPHFFAHWVVDKYITCHPTWA